MVATATLDVCPAAGAERDRAAEWPRFRGPGGDGVAAADPAQVPLRWGPDQNVQWRCETPGEGWSSPVVGRGKVFLSAAIKRPEDAESSRDSEQLDLSVVIIDAKSGDIQRVATLFSQDLSDAPGIHSKNSHASPTPILDGDRLYVHFGHLGTACCDLEGNVIWTQRSLRFPPTHGNGGSPVLVDGKLIFTCDGSRDPYVAALNAADGSVAWRTPRPVDAERKFSFATPTLITVDGQQQVIAPGSDCVLALEPSSGRILWQVRYDGYSVVPKPLFAGGLIYLSTGYNRASLLAIRPDGSGDVTDTHVVWRVDKSVSKTPSPTAAEDLLFLISDDGIAVCIEQASGDVVWRQRLGGNFSASPVRIGDRLYATDESGVTSVIGAGREYRLLAENDLQERVLASMAVAAPALYLRTDKALYRLQKP